MRGIYQVRLEALKLEAPAFCEFSTSMYGMLKVNCLMRQEITKVATVLQKQCLGTPKAKDICCIYLGLGYTFYSSLAFPCQHLATSDTKGNEQDYSQSGRPRQKRLGQLPTSLFSLLAVYPQPWVLLAYHSVLLCCPCIPDKLMVIEMLAEWGSLMQSSRACFTLGWLLGVEYGGGSNYINKGHMAYSWRSKYVRFSMFLREIIGPSANDLFSLLQEVLTVVKW